MYHRTLGPSGQAKPGPWIRYVCPALSSHERDHSSEYAPRFATESRSIVNGAVWPLISKGQAQLLSCLTIMPGVLVALLIVDVQNHCVDTIETTTLNIFPTFDSSSPSQSKLLNQQRLVVFKSIAISDEMDDDDAVTEAFRTCQLTKYDVFLVN